MSKFKDDKIEYHDDIYYSVGYDDYGNIDSVSYAGESIKYEYDKAGRLKKEDNDAADVNLNYRYDTLNNLMLTYHLNHDANGNISGYTNEQGTGNVSLTWTQGNKLETVTNSNGTYRYFYDENGLRYKKERIENGVVTSTTRYYYDGASIIAEDRDGELIQYYYDSTGVIGMSYNGEEYLYYKDIFGNITHIVDSDLEVVAEYQYDAWGNYGIETNVSGIATANPFRYRGYYMDAESDYYYLQTRYYSPVLRRFLSHDRYDLLSTCAEDGHLNLYTYCNNNPVMYTDPTGEFPLAFLIGLAVSFFVGSVASVLDQGLEKGWNEINGWQVVVDGLFAAANGALAYTGIHIGYSIAAGAILGLGQYATTSAINRESMSVIDAVMATGIGALGGAISGYGAKHNKTIQGGLKSMYQKQKLTGYQNLASLSTRKTVTMNNYLQKAFAGIISHEYLRVIRKTSLFTLAVGWGDAICFS